ncbi:Ig-like domain-containing protein, partial [Pseudomonas gingeri]
RDAYGNPYTATTTSSYVLFPQVSGVTIDPVRGEFVPGSATTSTRITSELEGSYSITATSGTGAPIGQPQLATFVESPDLARLALEMIDDNKMVSATAKNNKVRATVVMKDGSLVPEGTLVNFEADSDIVFSATSCQTVGETGQCEVTLGSTVAGTHRISARLEGGLSIMNVNTTFMAGFVHFSILTPFEGDRLANGVDAHRVTLTLYDDYGNPYNRSESSVLFSSSPNGATIHPSTLNFVMGNPSVSTHITSEQAVSYIVRASVTGVTLERTETVSFVAPSADESRSTFSVNDGSK